MAQFGGRGQRPGRPASAGGGGKFEVFLKSAVEKDKTSRKVWVLDDNPPYVVDDAGQPVLNKNDDFIPNWYNFEQHFDPTSRRSWPCARSEDADRCVGCEFPIEDESDDNDRGKAVRSTSSSYVVPVVDEKGFTSLIQIGWGCWKSFCANYKEYGTLTDAWYRITKDKVGGKTQYSVTKTADTERPELKAPAPTDSEISSVVGKRYIEAMERYDWNPEGDGFGDGIGETDGQRAAGGDEPQSVADVAADAAETQEQADLGADAIDWDPKLNAREAGVGELKDWLDNIPEGDKYGGPREYGKRPSRPFLVGLVEKVQSEFPGF